MSDSTKSKYSLIWTKEEVDEIEKWKKSTWKKRNCEICGSTDSFDLVMAPATATMFDRSQDKHRRDKVMLQILFECTSCGNTKTFSARNIGFGTKQSPGEVDKKLGASGKEVKK